jgi:hypothetical protein
MLLQANVIDVTPDSVIVRVRVNGDFETSLTFDQNTPGFRNICRDQEQKVVKGDTFNLNAKFHPGRPVGEQIEIIYVSRPVGGQTALMG